MEGVVICPKCNYNPSALVLFAWTLHIPRDPPSLNQRLHNAGGRRWAYKKERDQWGLWLKLARAEQRIPAATGKRRITLTRMYAGRQKERDQDNLAGGMKTVVDSLVLTGLLKDDSPRFAEIHYGQERVAAERVGLEIVVEELA